MTIDPSWNTDQGVLRVCKSLSVKLIRRNESKSVIRRVVRGPPASSTDPRTCSKDLSTSILVRTRKMANYACIGWSQKKFWWRLVAILTCKSFVKYTYSGERLIELSSSWFPPKFPSGQLELKTVQFHRVKRMIRGLGIVTILTYSQTLNRCDTITT